jgi:VanZ family protein
VRLLLIVSILFILYGSLYPFDFDFQRTDASPVFVLLHSWPARFTRFEFRDGASNILLYFPLGLAACAVLRRRAWAAVLLGGALSTGIEMLQLYDATRTCSGYDVVANLIGSALGALAALVLPLNRARWPERARRETPALALVVCWAVYQWYPFLPEIRLGHLRAGFHHLSAAPLSGVETVAAAGEWFALAMLAKALLGALPVRWLVLILLALPARLLILERSLDPAEAAGAAAALVLWAVIPDRRRGTAGACLLAAAIVLRELAPFRFAAEPGPFSWLPFSGTLAADRLPAVLVLFRKAYAYGAMVWLLRSWGPLRAGAALAASLAAMEWAQRWMPGRTPEITDSVLVLIMTAPLVRWRYFTARRARDASSA